MDPIVDELEKEMGDKVVFVKFNARMQKYTPYYRKYNIRSIPTLQFIGKDGKVKKQIVGFIPKTEIVKELNKIL